MNSGWLFSANTAATALSIAQLAIVARLLGPNQYGVLALVTTYTSTLNQFLDSRVWETAIAYIVRYRASGRIEQARAVLKLCYIVDLVTGLAAAAGILATSNWAAAVFLKDPGAAGLIRFYALSVVIAVPVGTSSALLRIAGRFDWLAYQGIGMAGARFVAVLAVALAGGGVAAVLVAYVAAGAVGTGLILFFGQRTIAKLDLRHWARARLRALEGERGQLARFLGATNLSALMKLLQRNADVLLVGYLFAPAAAGYLRAARSLTDLMNLPVGPIYTASYPEFVQLAEKRDGQGLRQIAGRVTFSGAAVGAAGLLGVAVAGSLVIRLALGAPYLPATPLLRWLAAGMALAVATSIWHPLLLALGRPSRSLLAIALGVICQFAVLAWLLPVFGVTAAGMASVAFHLAWALVAGTGALRGLQDV